MKKKIIIVDGFALIFRAFYAFISNPLKTTKGEPTSAIFGFLRMLVKTIKDFQPDYIVVALESKGPTFRKEIYPEYKANRDEPPEDLKTQIPIIFDVINAFNIANISISGYEADDVIATLATKFKNNKDLDVYILSGDKDLMQLVGDNVKCITSSKGISEIKIFDSAAVKEKFGVPPEKILEYLALTGDASDNIPGIRGVGPKTAVKLLTEHGNIDNIYEHLDRIKGKMRDKVAKGREDVRLSKELVTLKMDLDIDADLSNFVLPSFKNKEAIEILEKYELTNLLSDRFFREKLNNTTPKESVKKVSPKTTEEIKTPAKSTDAQKGKYEGIITKIEIEQIIEQIKECGYVSFDLETTSDNQMKAEIIGVALSMKSAEGYYIPCYHPSINADYDKDYFFKKLAEIAEDENIKIIGQNLKYEYVVLKNAGINLTNIYFDTMIASYVLNANRTRHNLDFLADEFLNYQTVKYTDLVNVKKGETLLDVDFSEVINYASEDADIAFRLYEKFALLLNKNELENVFFDIDMPLVKILGEIEYNGVQIDEKYLSDMSSNFNERIEKLTNLIYEQAGSEFNIKSTQQLSKILFEDLSLPPKKKTKTGFSTDNSVLEELKNDHPIIQNIIEYRTLSKLKSTYLDALPKQINEDTNKIHATFSQTVTATGRLSSYDPNLQNIPIRGDYGKEIRRGFVSSPENSIISADYSQIELRILAHVSKDELLINAYKNKADIHKQTASFIYELPTDKITAEMRAAAKTINFAVIYGRGARNLSKDLKITVKEATEFKNRYFTKYPGVTNYITHVKEQSAIDGFVKTLFGRTRYLTGYNSMNNRDIAQAERIAFNTIIQGTSADIIKLAMKNICKRFQEEGLKSKLIIQVHDELVFDVPDSEIDKATTLIKDEMENAAKFDVPLTVNINVGKNWDEAH